MTRSTRNSREETARLGKEIYERNICHHVEADHHGEVVDIDVGSGSYALGENAIAASEGLREHHPDAQGLADAGRTSGAVPLRGQFLAESWMIEGFVNANLEAVVTIPLLGPAGQTREVAAVVDTGFNGYLTLPPMLVTDLGLSVVGNGEAILADGSEVTFDVSGVTVVWDVQPRHFETAVVGIDALVGMMLQNRHSLFVEVASGGRVIVQPMESYGERPRGHPRSVHN